MSRMIYHNRRNPCPVCGSVSSKCRTTHDEGATLCMTYSDGDGDNRDYKFIKPSKDSLWGIHIPRSQDNFDPELSAKRRAEREKRRADEERRERELRSRSLPLDRRSSEFRQLLLGLPLDEDHYQNLSDRGLTDGQIKQGLYRSIISGVSDVSQYHPSLPGMREGRLWFGKKGDRGILCPAFDPHGRIVGCQVRLDDGENGRYRWLKGQFSSHLQNGELPITAIAPNGEITAIVLVEGILKPYVSANRYSDTFATVGAAGGNFAGSPEQLRSHLATLSERLGSQEICFAPDAGAQVNKHVIKRDRRTIELLRKWGYVVRVGDWGQWQTKDAPDFDELLDLAGVRWLDADLYIEAEERSQFIKWMQSRLDFGRHHQRKAIRKAVAVPELHYRNGALPLAAECDRLPKLIFNEGDRLKLYEELQDKGWLDRYGYVLDSSWMGTGKSHESGGLPFEKISYFDNNHRNVSTETVQKFADLNPRSQFGFIRNERGELVQDTAGDRAEIRGNCKYAGLFVALHNKGHNWHDGKENPICAGCDRVGYCKSQPGGYKHDRRETLGRSRIRLAPQSAPSPGDYDYSERAAIVEEAGRNLIATRSHSEAYGKILLEFSKLKAEGFGDIIAPIEDLLNPLINGEQGRYGIAHDEIVFLPPASDAVILQRVRDCENLLDRLHIEQCESLLDRDEVDSGLSAADRKKYRGALKAAKDYFDAEAKAEAKERIDAFPANVVRGLLNAYYFGLGSVRINHDRITVTERDERFARILAAHKIVILLDATPHRDRICGQLQIAPEDILQIEQARPDLSNLTVYSTQMEGLKTVNISDTAKARIAAYRAANPDAIAIGRKAWDDFDYYWFKDNIGSNDFEGIQRLTFYGSPDPNVGAVRDEMRVLGIADDKFAEYYEELRRGQILQAIGRPRSHRHPGEQFEIDFVGTDLDLSWLADYGIEVRSRFAFEVCPEAGSDRQIGRWKILQIARGIFAAGGKLTQSAIADGAKITQSAISQAVQGFSGGWQGFKKILVALYKQPYKAANNSDPIRDWLDLPPDDVLDIIAEVWRGASITGLIDLFAEFPLDVALYCLGLIAPIAVPEIIELRKT